LRADGLPHRAGAYVVINKALLSMVPPETRAHILAHECAHQRLGHTAHAPGNFRQLARAEAEADCEAVKIMRREFNMTNEAILRGLRAFKSPLLSGGEDTEHGSGTSRFHRGVACMIK
ncbi:MAG: hypothetical protein KKA05_05600, partial [Alphaproteobacteria bacterium]|nr:hypothetical protein [Alphaproteobacteria bacterium]